MNRSNNKPPSSNKPVAPPVYRPEAKPKTVQPKVTNIASNSKRPVAPPVYRPQPLPKVLQTKSSSAHSAAAASQTQRRQLASSFNRPDAKKLVQPKAVLPMRKPPIAPSLSKERSVPFTSSRNSVQLARREAKEGPGAQSKIQEKMIQVCDLMLGAGSVDPEVKKWAKVVKDNGLCGGWAAVHKSNPRAMARIWGALEDWNPRDGLRGLKGVDPEEVVALLSHAYAEMNELEPNAEYGYVPEAIASKSADLGPSRRLRNGIKSHMMVNEESGGGKAVLDRILSEPKVKKAGNTCIIEVGTALHYMSIRTRSIKGKITIEEIVESENSGVTLRPDKQQASKILEDGIYLEGMKDFKVDITIFVQD